jgi:archaellum component FlaC
MSSIDIKELLNKYLKELDELIEQLRKETIMVGAGASVINPKMLRHLFESYRTILEVMRTIKELGVEEVSEEVKRRKEIVEGIWQDIQKLKVKSKEKVKVEA